MYIWSGCAYVAAVAHGPYSARYALRKELRAAHRMRDWHAELDKAGLPSSSSQLSFLFILTTAVLVCAAYCESIISCLSGTPRSTTKPVG